MWAYEITGNSHYAKSKKVLREGVRLKLHIHDVGRYSERVSNRDWDTVPGPEGAPI